MKKLPIGIYNFSEIVTEGYYYVDKSYYVYQLARAGKYQQYVQAGRETILIGWTFPRQSETWWSLSMSRLNPDIPRLQKRCYYFSISFKQFV